MKRSILMLIALCAIFAVSCKHVETKKCETTCATPCKDSTSVVDSAKVAVDTVKVTK